MANECNYEMKIRGSKEAIQRVIKCLKSDYDYREGKPSHKHFFRIFDTYVEDSIKNKDGTFTQFIWGVCAWSVKSCMTEDGYYENSKKEYPDIFMGTTLKEQSQDCEIEVFSYEIGCCFSEHYLYRFGECENSECFELILMEEKENGSFVKIEDINNYDGDIVEYSPDTMESPDSGFKWNL